MKNVVHLQNVYLVELSPREVEYLKPIENLSRNLECVKGVISASLDDDGIRVGTNPNRLRAADCVAIEARRIITREFRRRKAALTDHADPFDVLPDVARAAASREGWTPAAVASHLVTFIRSGQVERYRDSSDEQMASGILCGYLRKMFSDTPATSWDMPPEIAALDWSDQQVIEAAMDFLEATFEPYAGEDWTAAFVHFVAREYMVDQEPVAAPGL